ncbi:helix-turn-helix domain-containing protein [Klebsiella pneumoniae]|nr:helix-turn-helix domain-containing protein [Klebsiella pneumoniae]
MNTKEQFLMIPYSILSDTNYSLPEKAVYSYLKGWDTAFPGVDKIANVTGLSPATVKRCTESLVKAGKLVKKRRFGNSNIYVCADWFEIDTQLAQNEPIVQSEETRIAQIDTIEQLNMSQRIAQIDTMNSSNCDTIILDIKSSIKTDSLNQFKEDEEVNDSKNSIDESAPSTVSKEVVSSSTVSSLPSVSNLTVVEPEQDDTPTPTESQSMTSNTPQSFITHDKYYISPDKEKAFKEQTERLKWAMDNGDPF